MVDRATLIFKPSQLRKINHPSLLLDNFGISVRIHDYGFNETKRPKGIIRKISAKIFGADNILNSMILHVQLNSVSKRTICPSITDGINQTCLIKEAYYDKIRD